TFLLVLWRFTKKTILLIFNHEKSFWITKPTFDDLKNTWYDFFNTPQIFFFYLILIAAILIINLATRRNLPPLEGIRGGLLYIVLCGVGTILICFAIGLITPIFIKRYVVYSIPFLCILIGFMVSKINNHSQRYIATALVCLISLYGFSKIDFRTPKHMNYRDAMLFIKQEKTNHTITLVQPKDMCALFAYYYDKAIFMDYYNTEVDLNKQHIYTILGADDLKAIDFTKYDKLILTQTFVPSGNANEAFLNEIATHYKTRTLIKEFEGIDIYLFK
ncbi:MAG TPA: hypothetical protein VF411_14805, partial [Bacteroidia bacterium]